MRGISFALLVLAAGRITATEQPTGSFICSYRGTWGCAPPNAPGGICVDSGSPQPKRFTLQMNFDSKPFPRIRLNGLDGHLLNARDPAGYSVVWHLGGLGRPGFSTSTR